VVPLRKQSSQRDREKGVKLPTLGQVKTVWNGDLKDRSAREAPDQLKRPDGRTPLPSQARKGAALIGHSRTKREMLGGGAASHDPGWSVSFERIRFKPSPIGQKLALLTPTRQHLIVGRASDSFESGIHWSTGHRVPAPLPWGITWR